MNDYKHARVFVSGGAGVIGSALVHRLYQLGAEIFAGDLKPRPDWPKEIRYRQGDLNEIGSKELEEFSPEYYFHLAATFERSEETYAFWEENFHHNVNLSHHLMDCLKESKRLKKIIFASSYLIYDPLLYLFHDPRREAVRIKENCRIQPRNLCGMAKLLHENELNFIQKYKKEDFSVVSARIFRSYGRNSRDIISRWIRALLNEEIITVYRKEGLFDFIFAEDVAEGLLYLGAGKKDVGPIVNLGRGRARSIVEVLQVLNRYFPQMKWEEKEADLPYEASEADMDKFRLMTAWEPEIDLEEAIPLLIKYYRNPHPTL